MSEIRTESSTSSEPRRPRSFDEYREAMGRLVDPQGLRRGLAFQPRPTDVVIAPYGKCGTTWLQQIVHGLRTRGDMEFDDISRVVPWIETAADLGIDIDAEQKANPRAFKSHLPWELVPKGARYIVSVRDPLDALVSMYRFMEGWFFEPGTVSIDEFARRQALDRTEGRDYWTHLLSWWRRRHAPDVLLLAYERMKDDLPGTVRKIASFVGIETEPEVVDLVVEQSSLSFMRRHGDRFDDRLMREHSEAVVPLPRGSDSSKVRDGLVGAGSRELGSAVVAELDAAWRESVAAETGLASYRELVAALGREDTSGARDPSHSRSS